MRIILLLISLNFGIILNVKGQVEGCSDGNYVYTMTMKHVETVQSIVLLINHYIARLVEFIYKHMIKTLSD